jgi:SH3-like domain-containing protein
MLGVFFLLLLFSPLAGAAEFASAASMETLVHSEPDEKSPVRFVVRKGYPFSILNRNGNWVHVRDRDDESGWVSENHLSDERHVIVSAPETSARERADDEAEILFKAKRGVIFKVIAQKDHWVHVRHFDGDTGWIKAADLWGTDRDADSKE